MKKWLFGLVMITFLSSFGACQRKNGCKGGGWYGNRNLSFVPKSTPAENLECEVKENEIVVDYEPATPVH